MPQWVEDFTSAFATKMGELTAILVVGLILIAVVAALAFFLGPELASRFSSSLQ